MQSNVPETPREPPDPTTDLDMIEPRGLIGDDNMMDDHENSVGWKFNHKEDAMDAVEESTMEISS